eukprot:TRINITY_DN1402_c0_g2_i1.p1 TRINITY_DN1402_c0_g2~~TRINITY_DN1402_c0_g2_i1.p1  ORF type:complete len:213 (+),score=13.20 TRINITY_DN1402_c0_g2_i1:112-750(+)
MMKQRLIVLALFGLVCGLALVEGEQILSGSWPAWVGYCVDSQGRDQNTGTIQVNGQQTRASCLAACKRRVPVATGCEFHSSGSCSIHTRPVSGGSSTRGYTCNVFELRFATAGFGAIAFGEREPKEDEVWFDYSANCQNIQGRDQETGTIRVGERTSSPDSCLSICKRVPSAVGCEFQNFNNGSCTIHTKPVIGGEETSATCYVWKKALILG